MTMAKVNESELLVPRGQPTDNPRIIFQSEAYTSLIRSVPVQSPVETTGALLGNVKRKNGWETVNIRKIAPIRLIGRGLGVFPDLDQWEELKGSLQQSGSAHGRRGPSVVGWYFTDPGMGLFPTRLDITEAHQALSPYAELLLLVNPSKQEGEFFVWQEGGLRSVGGFYERLPKVNAEPVIPWSGAISRGLGVT